MSIQIPNLHTFNQKQALVERGVVVLTARKDSSQSGQFVVNGDLRFLSSDPYPTGSLSIRIDLGVRSARFERERKEAQAWQNGHPEDKLDADDDGVPCESPSLGPSSHSFHIKQCPNKETIALKRPVSS